MVRESGQFFTLEGITASLILLSTVIFIVKSGLLTPFSHNNQGRLDDDQIAYDALVVLDSLPQEEESLTGAVSLWNGTGFRAEYLRLLKEAGLNDYLLSARVVYPVLQGTGSSYLIGEPGGIYSTPILSASRLVVLPDSFRKKVNHPPAMRDGRQVVRLEVRLWRV